MTQISFKKKIVFTAVVTVAFPVLILTCAELVIRLCIHFRYGVPGKKYGIYMADKELGAVHRPNSYNLNSLINNWGFRDSEDIQESKAQKDALRIYCSGGSVTFCYNLRTEDAWPSLLQAYLRQGRPNLHDEVLNGGNICFAIAQEFVLAKRIIPRLKPDIVILYGTGINEVLSADLLRSFGIDLDELLRKQRWGVFSRNVDQARFLKRNSALVKFYDYFVKKWIRNIFYKGHLPQTVVSRGPIKAPLIHPWIMENFEHVLRDYIAFLKDNGVKIIFVRYGDNGVPNSYFASHIRLFRDRAVEIAQSEGVPVYDFATVVEQNPGRVSLYIDSGVHVTKSGSELLAGGLSDFILRGDFGEKK